MNKFKPQNKNFITLGLDKLIWENKNGRGLIPDQGNCSLDTQLTEDRHMHASGSVQPSVP